MNVYQEFGVHSHFFQSICLFKIAYLLFVLCFNLVEACYKNGATKNGLLLNIYRPKHQRERMNLSGA